MLKLIWTKAKSYKHDRQPDILLKLIFLDHHTSRRMVAKFCIMVCHSLDKSIMLNMRPVSMSLSSYTGTLHKRAPIICGNYTLMVLFQADYIIGTYMCNISRPIIIKSYFETSDRNHNWTKAPWKWKKKVLNFFLETLLWIPSQRVLVDYIISCSFIYLFYDFLFTMYCYIFLQYSILKSYLYFYA